MDTDTIHFFFLFFILNIGKEYMNALVRPCHHITNKTNLIKFYWRSFLEHGPREMPTAACEHEAYAQIMSCNILKIYVDN